MNLEPCPNEIVLAGLFFRGWRFLKTEGRRSKIGMGNVQGFQNCTLHTAHGNCTLKTAR